MDRRRLIALDLVLLWLLTLHGLDHELRQPQATPNVVSLIGTLEFVLAAWALSLVLRRSPSAARATSVAGFAVAAAFAAVHLPPDWGLLSQPYADSGVDALSWIDLGVTIAVGLWIGYAAFAMQRPKPITKREAPWPSTER